MMEYQVKRRHLGEKLYEPGDTREANEGDVTHLIEAGVLVAAENKAVKSEPKKKAVKSAPKNKAE